MPLVRYTGTAHYRELSAADAKRANPPVEGFTKTTWTQGGVQDVSDSVSEWLLRDLPDEFEAAPDDEGTGARTMAAPLESGDAVTSDTPNEASGGGDAPAGRVGKSSTSGASTSRGRTS